MKKNKVPFYVLLGFVFVLVPGTVKGQVDFITSRIFSIEDAKAYLSKDVGERLVNVYGVYQEDKHVWIYYSYREGPIKNGTVEIVRLNSGKWFRFTKYKYVTK